MKGHNRRTMYLGILFLYAILLFSKLNSFAQNKLITQKLHSFNDLTAQSTIFFNQLVDDIKLSNSGNLIITISYGDKKIKIWNNLNKTILKEIELDGENFFVAKVGFLDETQGLIYLENYKGLHLRNIYEIDSEIDINNAKFFTINKDNTHYSYYNLSENKIKIGKVADLKKAFDKQKVDQNVISITIEENKVGGITLNNNSIAILKEDTCKFYTFDLSNEVINLYSKFKAGDETVTYNEIETLSFCKNGKNILFTGNGNCWTQEISTGKIEFTLPLINNITNGLNRAESNGLTYTKFDIINQGDSLVCIGKYFNNLLSGTNYSRNGIIQIWDINKSKLLSENGKTNQIRDLDLLALDEVNKLCVTVSFSGKMYLYDYELNEIIDEYKLAFNYSSSIYPFDEPKINLPFVRGTKTYYFDLREPGNIFKKYQSIKYYIHENSISDAHGKFFIVEKNNKEAFKTIKNGFSKWINYYFSSKDTVVEINIAFDKRNLIPIAIQDSSTIIAIQLPPGPGKIEINKVKINNSEANVEETASPLNADGTFLLHKLIPNSEDVILFYSEDYMMNKFILNIFNYKLMTSQYNLNYKSKKIFHNINVSEKGNYLATLYYDETVGKTIQNQPFTIKRQLYNNFEIVLWDLKKKIPKGIIKANFLIEEFLYKVNSHIGFEISEKNDLLLFFFNKKINVYKLSTLALLKTIVIDDLVNRVQFSPDNKYVIVGTESSGTKLFLNNWKIFRGESDYLISFESWEDNFLIKDFNSYYYSNKIAPSYLSLINKKKSYNFLEFDLQLNRPDKVIEKIPYASSNYTLYFKKLITKRKNLIRNEITSVDNNINSIFITNLNLFEPKKRFTNDSVAILSLNINKKFNLTSEINIIVNGVKTDYKVKESRYIKNLSYLTFILSTGLNKIVFYTTNSKEIRSNIQTFYVNYRNGTKPNLYIVGIGIENYKNFVNLDNMKNDVVDFITSYSALVSNTFNKIHINTILNENFNRTYLEKIILKLKGSSINDQIIIYYAGHGKFDKTNQDYFLLSPKSSLSDFKKSSIAISHLEMLLKSIPSRKKIIIINACESGIPDVDKNIYFKAKQLFPDLNYGSGLSIIASSYDDEESFSEIKARNSIFGSDLLACFDKSKFQSIDVNSDRKISFGELFRYIMASRDKNSSVVQHPNFRSENIDYDVILWDY